MRGNPGVIDALQKAVSMEASLAAQYRLDRRDLRYRSLKSLACRFQDLEECGESYQKSITDRLLFLGGKPVVSASSVEMAGTLTDMFSRALDAETAIVTFYNDAAIVAMDAKDDNTRNKFEHWIKWHEDDHVDFLEQQLAQIESMGEGEYIKVQLAKG